MSVGTNKTKQQWTHRAFIEKYNKIYFSTTKLLIMQTLQKILTFYSKSLSFTGSLNPAKNHKHGWVCRLNKRSGDHINIELVLQSSGDKRDRQCKKVSKCTDLSDQPYLVNLIKSILEQTYEKSDMWTVKSPFSESFPTTAWNHQKSIAIY